VKIIYFNKRERDKRVRGVILGQKLTLNRPSLLDEEEKTMVLAKSNMRERETSWMRFRHNLTNILFILVKMKKSCHVVVRPMHRFRGWQRSLGILAIIIRCLKILAMWHPCFSR